MNKTYFRTHSLLFYTFFYTMTFLLTASHLSSAEKIRGQVTGINGLPISQAEVIIVEQPERVFTDETGFFTIEVRLTSPRLALRIKHPDYFEQEFEITGPAEHKLFKFTLIPLVRQKEEVVVTATRFPELLTEVPLSGAVVSNITIEEKLAAHITDVVSQTTGVTSLGSGGFSIVPSIRGLARRRTLLMVDGSRISSDRRTGPNASFLNPLDLEKIEIFRSPSSVFYGSDAIGGVMNFLTYNPPDEDHFRLKGNLKYGTVNNEREIHLSLSGARSGWAYYFSARNDQADNYKSPENEIPLSFYNQSNLTGKIIKYSRNREITTSFILARGRDIGKPAINSSSKPTWYPRENHNLFQLNWKEKSLGPRVDLTFHFYLNPNFLETSTDSIKNNIKTQESFARTESTDYGAQLSLEYKYSSKIRITGGADFYGRAGCKAYNLYKNLNNIGQITEIKEEYPYIDGNRKDAGLFFSFDYLGVKKLDLTGGLRLDFLNSSAKTGGENLTTNKIALTGFMAVSYRLFNPLTIFANLSRAYRTPDINEKFYTGITGRGFIIANPELKNEAGQNFEAGLKFTGKRVFFGFYAFRYSIDNLIERFLIGNQLYTYGNVEKGILKGLEAEWDWVPFRGFSIFGNYHLYDGQSKITGNPLNDIPPQRLVLGSRIWLDKFNLELNAVFQDKKDNPGPAEIAIPSYELFNLKITYELNRYMNCYLRLNNILNKFYLARPDPDSREEPGRNLIFGLNFYY